MEERLPRLLSSGALSPPSQPGAAEALAGRWVATDIEVTGTDWRRSTADLAVAGLGWLAVGCAGPAVLRVWTLPGVGLATRPALVPDFAEQFERPGLSSLLPKAAGGAAGGGAGGGEGPAGQAGRAGGGGRGGGRGRGLGRGGAGRSTGRSSGRARSRD